MDVGLHVLSLFCASTSIYLDAGEVDAGARAMLLRELGEEGLKRERPEATLWVAIRREEKLNVEILLPPDRVVAARAFSLDAGLEPALRAAVLLITDAAAASYERPPEARRAPPHELLQAPSLAAGALAAPLRYGASIGLYSGWWPSPGTPQPGLSIGGFRVTEQLTFGVRLTGSGFGCCRLVSNALDGRPLELALYAEASRVFARSSRIDFGVLARAGAGYIRFRGQARYFDDEGSSIATTVQSRFGFDARAELGASMTFHLDEAVGLVVSGGATFRFARLVVDAPAITNDDQGLDPGAVAPFVELAARAQIF
jgi:hypothetical protein